MDSAASNQAIVMTSPEELASLDKEHLVAKVISMEQHIRQLKCIIQRQLEKEKNGSNETTKATTTSKKATRPFDFARFKQRHIFLKFLYLGWSYDGYVVQDDSLNTIEAALFEALLKTKLIQSRETANYHRCGRTDKGVSAFCQVVSLTVRSQMKQGAGLMVPENYSGPAEEAEQPMECDQIDLASAEIDYISALNGVLPKDIRVIAWAPIASSSTSARFDCRRRRYHYFFPRGQLHIERMNEACQHLVGEHDFRNLCKMDISNGVVNYVRHVFSAGVSGLVASSEAACDPYSICLFHIEASAFLWHQIRCIMGVLFLIGQGLEEPSVVASLLDVQANPAKPQYSMAADLPLVLYAAEYDDQQVPQWIFGRSNAALKATISQLHEEWTRKTVQSAITKAMIDSLAATYQEQFAEELQFGAIDSHSRTFLAGVQPRTHRPLLQRPKCNSLACRLEKQQTKKRIKLEL